jgi:hypothetical protein
MDRFTLVCANEIIEKSQLLGKFQFFIERKVWCEASTLDQIGAVKHFSSWLMRVILPVRMEYLQLRKTTKTASIFTRFILFFYS